MVSLTYRCCSGSLLLTRETWQVEWKSRESDVNRHISYRYRMRHDAHALDEPYIHCHYTYSPADQPFVLCPCWICTARTWSATPDPSHQRTPETKEEDQPHNRPKGYVDARDTPLGAFREVLRVGIGIPAAPQQHSQTRNTRHPGPTLHTEWHQRSVDVSTIVRIDAELYHLQPI